MNKLSSIAHGLTVAIALSAGGVLANTRCTQNRHRVLTATSPSPKPTTKRYQQQPMRRGLRRLRSRPSHQPPTLRLSFKLPQARKAKASRPPNPRVIRLQD